MASFGVHLFFVGELFAQAPVEQYPGCVVEAVTDSSRYFVIRIEDGNGKSLKQDFFYIHAFTWSLLKTDTSYKQFRDNLSLTMVKLKWSLTVYILLSFIFYKGRHAFIGLGFADRGDSFDFNVALQDHFK